MKFFIVLLLAYAAWASPSKSHRHREDKQAEVYWREYHGDVPRDAIDAGDSSSSDESVYIGQGHFHGVGLLPGTLHDGSSALQVTERENTPTTNKNVMILCSKHTVNVRWLEINSADIPCLQRIGGIKMVKGGVEKGVPVYIGRHEHEGSMQVGKVYTKAPYEGLHIVNKNGGSTHYRKFEILVYV